MSCRGQEQLFVAGASDAEIRGHVASCKACGEDAAVMEEISTVAAGLARPIWTPALRESLLSIPRRAITCATADEWTARSVDGELGVAERERLESHLGRCTACAAAAQMLLEIKDLARPEPAPWAMGRMAAALRAKSGEGRGRTGFAWLRTPRAAIAFAYAAALVVMLAGFNPADFARKAVPAALGQDTKAAIAEVRTSAVDRLGAWEDRALRRAAIWRARAGGYSRAALSRAIQLVMKSESASSPSRPRNGEDKGALPKNETAITTWRA